MNTNYVCNRYPLLESSLIELPLGSVKAEGWLYTQLKLQAEGLTGNLEKIWEDVGSNSGWLGGTGDNWERGPYYCDGLIPLAFILEDDGLIEKSMKWIEWTLKSQREDGFFGPEDNDDWWPRMIMLKVLKEYYEYTSDKRVISFMKKYFKYQYENIDKKPLRMWAKARGGENILAIYWLYNLTGDKFLIELAQIIFNQTLDWTTYFEDIPFKESMKNYLPWDKFVDIGWEKILTKKDMTDEQANELFNAYHMSHVVNVAMGIKEPILYYQQSKNPMHKNATKKGIVDLMKYHGVAYGMFTGDEHLSGNNPTQGTELCAVVEYMYSLENIIKVLAEGRIGDILEKVAFNALPATFTSDLCAHQYLQQANQVLCTIDQRNWYNNEDDANIYGLEPNFGCCTANMHQGWPKYVKNMWMATNDNGLAAITYGPCKVNAKVANGVNVMIKEETFYPFKDTILLEVNPENSVNFSLKVRIPQWCDDFKIRVNNKEIPVSYHDGFCLIDRVWEKGDSVFIKLPMDVKLTPWAYNSFSIERGPLIFGLKIAEEWKKIKGVEPFADWEVRPKTSWNYALVVNEDIKNNGFKVEENHIETQPFQSEKPPLKLLVKGRKVENWGINKNSADNIPLKYTLEEVEEDIELIPYGCTNIRISQFPIVKND